MPKEKSVNPAQAQRKAEKAKAIKKGKAQAATLRNEKLARRNPERLQKQLDELKALESSGGKLTSHEKGVLEGLERDLKAVRKAREALGDRAPRFGRDGGSGAGGRREDDDRQGARGQGAGVLGKRRRDGVIAGGTSSEEDEDEIPDDVRRIPMPRDTPPPIPKEVLNKWYQRRRERIGLPPNHHNHNHHHHNRTLNRGTSANTTPLGGPSRDFGHNDNNDNDNDDNDGEGSTANTSTKNDPPSKSYNPVVEAKTTYSAAPVIRDLRKEAVSFVPAAVRAKIERSRGATAGGLIEPEEMDRLEREGYGSIGGVAAAAAGGTGTAGSGGNTAGAGTGTGTPESAGRTKKNQVMMEEVDDEDD